MMSAYDTMPRMEASMVRNDTELVLKKAVKVVNNLKYRLNILASDLEIEETVIGKSNAADVFTCAASLSDEVHAAIRHACNELGTISGAPPAIGYRIDPEEETKRYYRDVVLPCDHVYSCLADDAIYIRTPMLWSRNNRMIRGDKCRTIGPEKNTNYRESVYYSILLDPSFDTYNFSKYKKKIIHYLYIYHDLPKNKLYLVDNDNHENKHVTDAIARFLPAGDAPQSCNFYSSAAVTDKLPEGAYITVTSMEDGIKTDQEIIQFWESRQIGSSEKAPEIN